MKTFLRMLLSLFLVAAREVVLETLIRELDKEMQKTADKRYDLQGPASRRPMHSNNYGRMSRPRPRQFRDSEPDEAPLED